MIGLLAALLLAQTTIADPLVPSRKARVNAAGNLQIECMNGTCSGGGGGASGTVAQGLSNDGGFAWHFDLEKVNGAPIGATNPIACRVTDGSGYYAALSDAQLRASPVPISASSLPLPTGAAQDSTLTGGTQKAIARGGAKGATTAADVTSTAEGTDHQAIDVQLYSGGVAKDPTQIRALASGTDSIACVESGTWSNRMQDGSGNALASSTSAPAGTEQALITRNIPSGTQTVSGSVTASGTVTAHQGTAAASSGAWPAKVTDGTNVAAVKAASTAAAAADPSLVCALSPNSPLPTGSNTIGALTANQSVNVNQVGGSAVGTAATGVQKVGVVGNAGAAIDAANNAAAPANVVAAGLETVASGSQPTAATGGNMRRLLGGTDGVPFARLGGPVTWCCGLSALAASVTSCKAAPGAGLKLYVTDVMVNTTTTTAGTWNLQSAPTTCGTSATAVLPAANTTDKFTAPISTAQPQFLSFATAVALAANTPLCAIGTTTNTINLTVCGYTAP